MRAETRRSLGACVGAALLALPLGLGVGAAGYGLGALLRHPVPSLKTPPVHRVDPVPHPRCFPPGTDGAAEFRLCPDGLIENNRSI